MLTALPLLRNTQNIFNSDWLAHGWLAGLLLRLLARPTSACAAYEERERSSHSFQRSLTVKYCTHFVLALCCCRRCYCHRWMAGGESACNTVCRRCLRSRINYSVCIMETNKFLMAFTRHRARFAHQPVNEWKSCENFTRHFLIAYSVSAAGEFSWLRLSALGTVLNIASQMTSHFLFLSVYGQFRSRLRTNAKRFFLSLYCQHFSICFDAYSMRCQIRQKRKN